jgi:hypothetical protein
MGGRGHSWWPIFLWPVIFPISFLFDIVSDVALDWLVPDPKAAPNWVWSAYDWVSGCFYIVAGSAWMFYIGKCLSFIFDRLSRRRDAAKSSASP